MADMNQLNMILAHFYARIESGKSLSELRLDDRFIQHTSLGRNRIYKKVHIGLKSGKTFSESLSGIKGVPAFVSEIIEKGEKTGNLAASLKIVLNHSSIFGSYTYHLRKIVTYVSAILIVLLALLIYYSILFTNIQAGMVDNLPIQVPKYYQLFYVLSQKQFFAGIGAVFTVLIVFLFKTDLTGMIIRHTPFLKKNYFRILSLEFGMMMDHHLSLDTPLDDALHSASKSIRDKTLKKVLDRSILKSKGGNSISNAMFSEPILSKMDIVNTIKLGDNSGNIKELIKELNKLLHDYLSENLDRDMQNFFRWCVAGSGILVGIGIVYIFSAIIFTYSLI